MPLRSTVFALLAVVASPLHSLAQTPPPPAPDSAEARIRDQNEGGRISPAYPAPYTPAPIAEITSVMDRVCHYLDATTPARLVDRTTGQAITDFSQPLQNAIVARGDFQLVSYEWGVTYGAMLQSAEVTGDARFRDYALKRLGFIADVAPLFPPPPEVPESTRLPGEVGSPQGRGMPAGMFRSVNAPHSLDDAGAMCAAMIKALRAGAPAEKLRPIIDRYIAWISTGQYRLADGTLARNRPLANAVWLDDLYMSVPALAQMGALTGERKYFDDAVKQFLQFSARMFVKEKNLYLHGWIEGMDTHPAFHWGRANGWAILAATELLDVLPADHAGRAAVLDLYRAHVRGLAATQGGAGMWHQLLDRTDSYPETSATAIFTYCIARGINRGWLDPLAHGPMVSLAWNAVAEQVNARGQVENVCVGTGMGFDPAFYYYRPVSVYAAHGYGPVLLAGAEMIVLRKGKGAQALVSDGAVQLQPSPSRH